MLILLVAGIALGIYLVQNRTNIFPQASISGPVNPRTAFSFKAVKNSTSVGGVVDVDITASSDFDAAGIEKGSGKQALKKAGTITRAQVKAIAEKKMPDLNASDINAAMRIIEGSCRSLGVEVKG
jgi:hypothetical protein